MTDPQTPPSQTSAPAPRPSRARALGIVGVAMVAGAAFGALALYGMNGLSGNAPQPAAAPSAAQSVSAKDPGCAGSLDTARRLTPLVKGEVAAFQLASEPRRVPDLAFADEAGRPLSLADFRGKVLLVNLWATWCVPCRKEMPFLDTLEKDYGGKDFEVVAINLDTRDPQKPKDFLKEINVSALAFRADPGTKSFQALRAVGRGFGLPTTLLVDGKGCEIGFLAGPAEWASEDARALIQGALGRAPG